MTDQGICNFCLLHRADEAGEEVVAVLRAGRGFRVILHRENRVALERQAAIRAVEERDMGFDDALGQGCRDRR